MFRSILVPLDGSKFGEWSLPTAIAIAKRTEAALELVTVTVPVPRAIAVELPGYDSAHEAAMQERAEAYLRSVAERITAVAPLTVHTTVRCGQVAEALLEHVDDAGCDLIVSTTHGRGPLTRMWLGSVANAVVRHSAVPVLLIRPEEENEPDLTQDRLFRRVLVPLDGSPNSVEVLDAAIAVGELARADYVLLEVIYPPLVLAPAYGTMPPPPIDDRLLTEQKELAEKYLAGVAGELRRRDYWVDTAVRDEPSPATAILEYARTHEVDLIAMATHGRGGLGKLVMGSVADKVVRGASTPVLLYRPHGKAGGSA
jgi:nucleotide-binding universal stress UspA family protein